MDSVKVALTHFLFFFSSPAINPALCSILFSSLCGSFFFDPWSTWNCPQRLLISAINHANVGIIHPSLGPPPQNALYPVYQPASAIRYFSKRMGFWIYDLISAGSKTPPRNTSASNPSTCPPANGPIRSLKRPPGGWPLI